MPMLTRRTLHLILCLAALLPLARPAPAQVPVAPAQAPAAPPAHFEPATGTIVDARWKSGVPLGGIGVGKIELLSDGSFGNFTTNHNWDRPYGWAKGAFAALRVQAEGGKPVAKLLRLTSADEYGGVANVAHTRMQGWFPTARMDYTDPDLPIQVQLNAFSPLIPHDPKNSSLPVACLSYTLTNPTGQTVKTNLLLAWPNLLGWGGRVGVAWDDLSGDTQTGAKAGALTGLRYATTQSYPDQHQDVVGEWFVGAGGERGTKVTTCANWDAADKTPAFWADFAATGRLNAGAGVAKNPAGAVSAETTLAPGQSRTVRFVVAWAMPHQITMQKRTAYGPDTEQSQTDVAALFDLDPATRWATGRAMQPGDNLVVDLGAAKPLDSVAMTTGTKNPDTPNGLRVEVSDDGKAWQKAAELNAAAVTAAVKDGLFTVPLAGAKGRYLRLTNLNADSFFWWSIYGLTVKAQGQDAPLALAKDAATAYLVRSETKNVTEDVGHYWQNAWHSAGEIAAYADTNHDRLLRETQAWQTPVQNSTLPFWLKLKLINCVFPMYSNTILTKDGRFVVQESPIDMGGATGTMDQRMAAHAFYTMFFPALDRAELESFADCQQPDGSITHFDGNIHETIGRPDVGYGITGWPDLSSAWVLQVAKLGRWTGDRAFLDRMAPHVTRAMDYLDKDGQDDNGIPAGGSTYDYEQLPRGEFIYSASCYLGALRAASALGTPAQASVYDARLAKTQTAVMTDLWNGTFFRKWKSPTTPQVNENSFVANLAGDWLARLTGLPRTLSPDIIHKSITQTIARHQKSFFPVPPMEVTPEGKLATSACYLLQHEPYLGCEAIYENYVDDGLDTLHRVYLCVWELNHSPWDESLVYDAPTGAQGGLRTYVTCPTTWHVLPALGGLSLDLLHGTLFVSPRLSAGQTTMRLPVYFPRFWGTLDYDATARRLTLHVDRVFPSDAPTERTLYHVPGPTDGGEAPLTLTQVAADGDSPPIPLPQPFTVTEGATLDLSPLLARLAPPAHSPPVTFAVRAAVHRPGLPADDWTLTDNVRDSPELAAAYGAAALDGDPATRWTTGRAMQPGDRLTLDMGHTQKVAKITLDDAASPNDYPHGYVVEASPDGLTWKEVARATADEAAAAQQKGVLAISFPPTDARYLRITNQGLAPGLFWSVHELTVEGAP